VIVLDPFAELHNVTENSNDQIKVVGQTLRKIAKATGAAVIFAAHSRKPDSAAAVHDRPGDLHVMRGASALSGVIRMAFTVTPMTVADADSFRIPPERRHAYVNVSMAKNNLGPMDGIARWYERIGVTMGPMGHEFQVGALKPAWLTRVTDENAPLWVVLERIILAHDDMPNDGLYQPKDVMLRASAADQYAFRDPRVMSNRLHDWFDSGPVKEGTELRMELMRVGAGRTARWRLRTLPKGQEPDYLG
jgi:hypothetical protein